MKNDEPYIIRGKIILSISTLFVVIAIILYSFQSIDFSNSSYILAYETIDIKTMGVAKVALKKESIDNTLITTISTEKNNTFKEVTLASTNSSAAAESTQVTQLSVKPQSTWRLPTEHGYITQYASYNHIALDITSARGVNETIYPIADGVITSITHDTAGAKIVTVNHYINGQYYTSQYVHLAWFDGSIYVGKNVTTNNPLGAMGTTGVSTGIHLHITVLDCNLYDPNDANCSTLNGFYNYGRVRLTQGFNGLTSIMNVPYSWYSR